MGYYHCISRVVNREFALGADEREHLVKLMRNYEAFCGVNVMTYCIMPNHFHFLVEVPLRPGTEGLPTDAELVSRLRRSKNSYGSGTLERELQGFRSENDHAAADALRERFFSRMWDVSWFMRLVKQRYTQWHNKRARRMGTFWEDRFKSIIIDGSPETLSKTAMQIDLTAFRAGLVNEADGYRWSGLGAARAGNQYAREGLGLIVNAIHGRTVAPQRIVAEYRNLLPADLSNPPAAPTIQPVPEPCLRPELETPKISETPRWFQTNSAPLAEAV